MYPILDTDHAFNPVYFNAHAVLQGGSMPRPMLVTGALAGVNSHLFFVPAEPGSEGVGGKARNHL